MIIDRFAPSPTGLLHIGHAFSAWLGWHGARQQGGRFLLRMEDLDAARVRPEYYEAIERDLAWLGIDWDGPVLLQSTRSAAYADALELLARQGLTYRCTCTRRDIADAATAPHGPDGPVYPGTCRDMRQPAEAPHALRLDLGASIDWLGGEARVAELGFHESGAGPMEETGWQPLRAAHLSEQTGDIVLRRRDGAVAYHLAVVVDDAHQGVSRVTRGCDLFAATPIQRLLQALLDLPTPQYRHHRLITDASGKRLAKRDDARAIARYREDGLSPREVLALAGG